VRAGELRHRITLQARPATKDGLGQESDAFADVATVWAKVEPLAGRELLTAQQVLATVTHKVTLRYRDGVTAKMRVLWGVRTFDVEVVLNLQEQDTELNLLCVERP
jgi:SPP1 family predicted phage head-tail adaptor